MLDLIDRRMKHAGFIALAGLLGAASCEPSKAEKSAPQYGDPVGIQLVATQDVPAVEVAVAVSQGVPIEPLVEPLSSLFFKALKGCSSSVKSALLAEPAQISFSVEMGKTKNPAVTGGLSECMKKSLDAQVFAGKAPSPLHVMAMVRLASAAAPGSSEGRKP